MIGHGAVTKELTMFTKLEWADRKETRKSSREGVLMTGKHTLKAYMWVQDEIRSQRIQARSMRSEESAADLRKEQISRTAIVKHYLRSGQMNMKSGVSRMDDKQQQRLWNSAQQWVTMSRSLAVMISRNRRCSSSRSSWLPGLCVGEERLHEVRADEDGLMNEEEGEVFIKFMDKMGGTELRSSMASSWKRDSRFVNALGTDGDSRMSLQRIFDDLEDTTSLKGEFVKVLKENGDDGNRYALRRRGDWRHR